jgi:hypothetical protein
MNRPLRIGPDGIVEFATRREVAHLNHCLEAQPTPELSATPVGKSRTKKGRHTAPILHRVSDLPPIASFVRRAKPRLPLKNCPFCNCQVREDRLQGHLITRCPLRPSNAKHTAVAAPPQLKKLRANPKPISSIGRSFEASQDLIRYKPEDGEAESPSWKNNLDATKNCGYPAREEGRYGSYPSHDGFDDESEP